MSSQLKVLITGAAGKVGGCLFDSFRERYSVRTFDINPVPGDPDTVIGNLTDREAIQRAMAGIEVVVHLAAAPREMDFYEQLLPNNLLGVHNVFEAAVHAGVRRVVFASTSQTVARYPESLTVRSSDPVRPSTLYGCTKVFGETLGRYYHDVKGMECVVIRLGWVKHRNVSKPEMDEFYRNNVITRRDVQNIFHCAVERPDVGFVIVHGTSKTRHEYLSLTEAREKLGYEPLDDFEEVLKSYGHV